MAWLIKFNSFTNILALLIGLIAYKHFSKEIKTVFFYVALGALSELYFRIHVYYLMKNGMPIGHFYFPIAIFIAGMFYKQILNNFIKPVYIIVIIVVYEIYCIINPILVQGLFEYPSLTGSIGALIIFLFSIAYFIKVMVEANIDRLSKEPLIWINTAFLVYYTAGFFYHSLYNLRTTASMEVAILAIKFNSILNLLFYSIFIVAFVLAVKKQHTNFDHSIKYWLTNWFHYSKQK